MSYVSKQWSAGLVVLVGLFFFLCPVKEGRAADIKIVSIDTSKVFEAHPAFKEAMGKFQAQVQEMQKKIEGIEKEEEKTKAQIEMQQQMRQIATDLQEEAFNKMKADVQKLAKKKGYTYVVDQNALIAGGQDITEEVINSFKEIEDASGKKQK